MISAFRAGRQRRHALLCPIFELRGDEFCGNRGFGHLLFNLTARYQCGEFLEIIRDAMKSGFSREREPELAKLLIQGGVIVHESAPPLEKRQETSKEDSDKRGQNDDKRALR